MTQATAVRCVLCGGALERSVVVCRDHLVSGETFTVMACAACDLAATTPRPDAEALARYYPTEAYLPWTDDGGGLLGATYRFIRRWTVRDRMHLFGRPTGRVLDIGCGTGAFLRHARTCGWDVVGVEPSDVAATQAERQGLRVYRSTTAAVSAEAPFDAVVLWHTLEHLHAPATVLADVRRVLRSDGCLVVAVPNHASLDAQVYGADWFAWDVPRHLHHFTPLTLQRLLGGSGFRVATVAALPFDPFYIALMSEIRVRRGRALGRAMSVGWRSHRAARRDPTRGSAVVVVARLAPGQGVA